jgi:NADPH-dependent curcumin reductase CurA
MIPNVNARIVLAARPRGAPTPTDFRLEEVPCPQVPPPGGVLLQTLWLSLDPYMRGRMSEGPSYAPAVGLGEVMCGATVSRVLASRSPQFAVGDLVLGMGGWQAIAALPAEGLVRLDPDAGIPPSWALGVLGMPGLTAYVGLLDLGQPQAGETVVVAAATGPVGATVGQIAKLKGCRVVGVAGGAEKCALAVEELGFDTCLDHHAEDFAAQLKAACPQGIDVYFENVGGHVLEAAIPLLNVGARVPVCGVIAWYNLSGPPPGPDRLPALMRQVLVQRLRLQGFIVSDHLHRQADFQRDMRGWLAAGQIRYREDVVEGLRQAPMAFIGLLRGDNLGKLVIKVAD